MRGKRNIRIALFFIFLFPGYLSAGVFDSWTYQSKITFRGYGRQPLTNFPALVVLGTNIPALQYQDFQANGTDLRFADSNETVELKYELEKWNSNGQSVAWIQVPLLSGTNTFIWAYWGKATNLAPAYTTNGLVWDSNHLTVYHMQVSNATDATANRYNATASTAVKHMPDTWIDGANDFTRNTSFISVPDQAAFTLSGPYTVSAWIYSDPVANTWEGFVGTYNNNGFIFTLDNSASNQPAFWASGLWRYAGVGVLDNQWLHLVYTRNGTTGTFYINGRRVRVISDAVAGSNGGNLHLGAAGTSWTTLRFDGLVDEVRISTIDRSSNWVWACAMNQGSNATFNTYGIVDYPTLTAVSLPPSDINIRSGTLNGIVGNSGGGPSPELWFCYDTQDRGTATTSAWARVVYAGNSWSAGQTFGLNVTNLSQATTCVYRVYATNSTGVDWSYLQSFRVKTEWRVAKTGSDAPSTHGTNWASAFLTISNGLTHAQAGDIVQVSNGTYQITAQLFIDQAVTVRGFNGVDVTVIDCDVPGNTTPPIRINHAEAILERFKIIDCNELTYNNFGPINLSAGTVRYCTMTANNCVSSGGGYLNGGLIHDCIITNNFASHWNTGWGGGLRVAGGVVSNCFIGNNRCADGGGGIYMTAGRVVQCVISNNAGTRDPGTYGGGVYMTGGVLENCLVITNRLSPVNATQGAGIYMSGGVMVNCTVADNRRSGGAAGSGLYQTGGFITNCIFYYNSGTYPASGSENVQQTAGTITYSCMQPLVSGTGNLEDNPDFVNRPAWNYRLNFGSPCVDAGITVPSINVDLAGTNRPLDGNADTVAEYDMGCYEQEPAGTIFVCDFDGTPVQGTNSQAVIFTASTAGPGTSTVTYCWDWTNSGTINLAGTTRRVVTNVYAQPGTYAVRLVCTNALGSTATKTKFQHIKIWPGTTYVALGAGNVAPYDSWAKATPTLANALAEVGSGGNIFISNGTFSVTARMDVEKPVTIQSVNGRDVTTLQTTGSQLFQVKVPNVVIDGFTMRGANLSYGYYGIVELLAGGTVRNCKIINNLIGSGGGVYLTHASALVEDCIITNNRATHQNSGYGGGIRMTSGLVRNCYIAKNQANDGGGGVYMTSGTISNCTVFRNTRSGGNSSRYGGGVWMTGGSVLRCQIDSNQVIGATSAGGGGVYMTGGNLQNAVIRYNSTTNSGGGVYQSGGLIESATLVENTAWGDKGGGLYQTSGSATNVIIHGNTSTGPGQDELGGPVTNMGYCCSSPLTPGVKGNITGTPLFVDAASHNHQLAPGSPGINAGTNLAWMTSGQDLAGKQRVKQGRVDMGAYELQGKVGAVFLFR
ncbi:MAG: hypothetical protein A2340_03125 [Lentisphaerae bacterium RIFOXYB12_FULL_60_10]|nr:MAG: hypothetical protein A2340_03125 [Lentisphaerae bacterium RIFOXYB12_FULL_60_10]